MMLRKLKSLLTWELQRTYRFPILELILATLVIVLVGLGEPSLTVGHISSGVFEVARYIAAIFDFSFFIGILFLTILTSTSIAQALEEGEMKVLLSYPLSRFKVITTKIVLNFGIFLLLYVSLLGVFFFVLAPTALLDQVFYVMVLGIGVYLLFFVSLASFVGVASRSVKTSIIIMTIIVFLVLFGLNSLILKNITFLLSLVVTYAEYRWEFTSSSTIQTPFPLVFISYIVISLILLILTIVYFNRYVEV